MGRVSRFPTLMTVALATVFLGPGPCGGPDPDPDVNDDGVVNILDISFVSSCLGEDISVNLQCAAADADVDGDVDQDDLDFVLAHFGESGFPLAEITVPTLDPHPKTTSEPTITLTGRAPTDSSVEVSAPDAVFVVDTSDGAFAADVPLRPNAANDIFLVAIASSGLRSATTMTSVVQDMIPPNLFIDFPDDGAEITTPTTDVAGRVGDVLSGFMGLEVTVNGAAAIVDVGIGTNGTFFLQSVPLAMGSPTVIEVVATDELGNSVTQQITVEFVEIPPDMPRMEVISGNAQTGAVAEVLADPIVVRVTHGDGSPFAGKIVNFDVARSDGLLSEEAEGDGVQMLQVRTDLAGEAGAFWQLGSDSGCGNNRVEVTSTSIAGTTFFCASASVSVATQLNIGSGNNQRIEAGATAEPLVVWVNDGRNGVPGVPVIFNVVRGGGNVEGFAAVVAVSGLTGHASVRFVSGLNGGNNVVNATFPGNTGPPAAFSVFGILRAEAMPTIFGGLVIDNASRPIGGAECVLAVNGVPLPSTTTDVEGQFSFADVPPGPARLTVDGLVAFLLDGQSIPAGSFPALSYDTVIVPNATNSLPSPVQLPMLNPANAVEFDNTVAVELTVEEIDGLSMLVAAGSMTRADGTVPSPGDPAILTLNQVHADDIPMPIPDGASPPFAWTLQPAGAHFDPPIEITYPNMSGLAPGAIAYFLSFNHDTGKFEIVSTGSVTEDGAFIVSDSGGGLSVSGWGCNCPPYAVAGDCESCELPGGGGGGECQPAFGLAALAATGWSPLADCTKKCGDGCTKVPTEESCCKEKAATDAFKGANGAVVCCGGSISFCIDPNLPGDNPGDSKGEKSVRKCVGAHEQYHVDTDCVGCPTGAGKCKTTGGCLGNPANFTECGGNTAELACLKIEKTACGFPCPAAPLPADPVCVACVAAVNAEIIDTETKIGTPPCTPTFP